MSRRIVVQGPYAIILRPTTTSEVEALARKVDFCKKLLGAKLQLIQTLHIAEFDMADCRKLAQSVCSVYHVRYCVRNPLRTGSSRNGPFQSEIRHFTYRESTDLAKRVYMEMRITISDLVSKKIDGKNRD